MDRFERGLPDSQDSPISLISCEYAGCTEVMVSGDDCWILDDRYFCSAKCNALDSGAEKGKIK